MENEQFFCINKLNSKGPSPIPVEGNYIQTKDISQISGFSHGCGTCAPQQGACKLTLNVKDGIIKEALVDSLNNEAALPTSIQNIAMTLIEIIGGIFVFLFSFFVLFS